MLLGKLEGIYSVDCITCILLHFVFTVFFCFCCRDELVACFPISSHLNILHHLFCFISVQLQTSKQCVSRAVNLLRDTPVLLDSDVKCQAEASNLVRTGNV